MLTPAPQVAHEWLRDYAQVALRLDRIVQAHRGSSLLDYLGPPEWRAEVESEPMWSWPRLRDAVAGLREGLAEQGFEPRRARFLSRHLDAFRTVARRLGGEPLSLEEEVLGCLDLRVGWLPETLFEAGHDLYDAGLPGVGRLAERLRRWRARTTLPPGRSHLLTALLQRALAHARQLTHAMLPLPADEDVDIAHVDQPAWAVAAYEGSHRSRILVNPLVPFPLPDLFYVLCHEGYPGHLTEILLKEEALVDRRGCLEQQARFLLTPGFVVSEGLALLAHEMVFAPGEEERWLAEHVYPEAGMRPEGDPRSIHLARDILRGASCNAAFLLREGRPAPEVVSYLVRHALVDEERAREELARLSRPLGEVHPFAYFHGRRLVEARLGGPGRLASLQWLMTTQVLPSELE
ncbi:MAG TPA: hypothetical protein VKF59_01950 [Candidatus Dormibacteraeota bacterium]|nr:hypothetical protein [Candidatus Dormibacteraeota bacterium]